MPTIMVDPDDMGVMTGTMTPPDPNFVPTPIRRRVSEPIPAEAECYVLAGRPHLLFANWDYAEDWSGEYVREVHPFAVALGGKAIAEQEWRELINQSQRKI